MQELELYSIWEAKRSAGTSVHFHTHTYHELVYYPQGNGIANIDGVDYTYGPNTFLIIPPNIKHDEIRQTNSQILCLAFSCTHEFKEVFYQVDDSKNIYKILKAILNESIQQAYNYHDMIAAKMTELLIHISRIHNTGISKSKNFQYMIHYLKDNFYEKIQLRDCAAQLNISYDYFQHKFKEITGLSPQQFLLEHRLAAAEELLLNRDMSCTEIAYRCGFSTSAQFSMLFKRKHNLSPFQYRTKNEGSAY